VLIVTLSFGVIAQFVPALSDFSKSYFNGKSVYAAAYQKAVKKVYLSHDKVELKVGQTFGIVKTMSPYNATNQNVTWSVSDAKVIKIQTDIHGHCTITALKEGTAFITVKSVEGGFTAKTKVVVSKAVQVLAKDIIPSAKNVTIKVKQAARIGVTFNPTNVTNKTLIFTSSNTGVVSVDSMGLIKGNRKGTAKITIKNPASGKTTVVQVQVK
jgi:uncharacterized protein YjdB